MSNVKLAGNVSGTGSITIASPNTNSDISISLPTVTGGSFIVSDSSGNVGIGTTSPSQRLQVNGPTVTQILYNTNAVANDDAAASIKTYSSATALWNYLNFDASSYRFNTYGAERMRIDSSGNVGIGTSSPSYPLDVAGAIRGNSWIGRANSSAPTADAFVYRPADNSLGFGTANTERGRFDSSGNFQFNSGYGSVATAYGCRAWVNFNGTGTPAIRASGNVSSITDNGTGDYTVNFTNAMPDGNYCVNVSAPMYTTSNGSVTAKVYGSGTVGLAGLQSTTQIRVCWTDILGTANFYDPANYYVSIFR